jgi:hypothetical protein
VIYIPERSRLASVIENAPLITVHGVFYSINTVSGTVMIYYVALPFQNVEGGLVPGRPVGIPSSGPAQAMSSDATDAGAVAFLRRCIPMLASSTTPRY